MSKADLYLEFLRERGYEPRLDEDGDLVFQHQGLTFLLMADEDDETCFRLLLPGIWKVETPSERETAVEVMDRLHAEVKVVKFHTVRDLVWATVELLFDPIDGFRAVFDRALALLVVGAIAFREAMQPGH